MADYSQWLQENEDLVNQALASYDASAAQDPQPAVTDAQLLGAASPAPSAPAPAPAVAPVEMPTGRPRQALAQVQEQQVDSANQQIASVLREGQAERASSAEQSALIGESAVTARGIADEARTRHQATQERVDRYTKQRDEVIAKLSEPLPQLSTGRRVGTIIAGIVGVMGSLTGVNGLAYGMQAVQEMIGSRLREQLQDRERNKELLGVLNDTIKSLGSEDLTELNQARVLAANELLVTEQEVRKVAKDLEGTKAGEDAIQLAEQLREKALGNIAAIQQQRIAEADARAQAAAQRRAQEAATAEEAQLYTGLARARTDQERQDIAALYGAKGAKALKEFYDNRKAGVESSPELMGNDPDSLFEATGRRDDKQQAEHDKIASAYGGMRPHFQKMLELTGKSGKVARVQFNASLRAAASRLSVARGQGALSDQEAASYAESFVPPETWDRWDTFNAREREEIVRGVIRALEDEVDGSMRPYKARLRQEARVSGKTQFEEGAPEDRMRPVPGGAPAAGGGRVAMRDPRTGQTIMVKPELVERFAAKGYVAEQSQQQAAASQAVRSFFGGPGGQLPRWSQGR